MEELIYYKKIIQILIEKFGNVWIGWHNSGIKTKATSVNTLYKQELKENDTIRYLTSAFYGAKFMLNTLEFSNITS